MYFSVSTTGVVEIISHRKEMYIDSNAESRISLSNQIFIAQLSDFA